MVEKMSEIILSLNSGSSSLKFSIYQFNDSGGILSAKGAVEQIGLRGGRLWIRGADGGLITDKNREFTDHSSAIEKAFEHFQQLNLPIPDAVGHRVVHGGPDHAVPVRIDAKVFDDLKALIPYAPLHQPGTLKGIEAVTARFPDIPQVACFDTAFHRRMPGIAQQFAIPRSLYEEGVRRYGFHGLSFEYVLDSVKSASQGRTIIAHLGYGSSMAAVLDGQPMDTTMGLTPTGGLMMSTRCGDLDPGILFYLMNEKGFNAQRLDQLLNMESGLLGVSGISPDMKTLLDIRKKEPAAAEAVEMFCYQVRKQIGSLAAALGGLDNLIFTGGIGERAAPVRREICEGLEHLGVHIDVQRNQIHADVITVPQSACTCRIVMTDEELMIARHTCKLFFLYNESN